MLTQENDLNLTIPRTIFPDVCDYMNIYDLEICELFITKMHYSPHAIINLQVYPNHKIIKSNDRGIADIILLVFREERMQKFYLQLKALLHKADEDYIGKIKVTIDDKSFEYAFKEHQAFPNFKWDIIKL